jgi:Tfp pilus assembly pilus retraction ATPase PilT
VSQRLIPATDGSLVLNPDVLVATARLRDMLREAAPASALQEAMFEGAYYGMKTFDQDLAEKCREGVVDEKTALAYATNLQDFKLMLAGSLVTRGAAESSLSFIEEQ